MKNIYYKYEFSHMWKAVIIANVNTYYLDQRHKTHGTTNTQCYNIYKNKNKILQKSFLTINKNKNNLK